MGSRCSVADIDQFLLDLVGDSCHDEYSPFSHEIQTMIALIVFLICVGLLFAANGIASSCRRSNAEPTTIGQFIVANTIFSLVTMCLFPYVILLLLTTIVCVRWNVTARKTWLFTTFAVLFTMMFIGNLMMIDYRRRMPLLERYPFVSMEERIPKPQEPFEPSSLNSEQSVELTTLENRIPRDRLFREMALRRLHNNQFLDFIDEAGFGFRRGIRPGGNVILRSDKEYELNTVPIPQLQVTQFDHSPLMPESAADLFWTRTHFQDVHRDSIVDFVQSAYFGYQKDRQHVAGFKPHAFSERPTMPDCYVVNRIELIGVLMHQQPVVYLSDHLPRMEDLKQAKTRELDDFERKALEQFRSGRDLVFQEHASGIRMVGAIRSVNQCTTCHGSQRGQLLGAFSYQIGRE